MAEITTNSKPKKGHRKIHSTRIDLTPMVDLGFLLLTFFVFTTTLAKANAMRLVLPKDDCKDCNTNTPQSGALTLIADEGKVWYYNGMLEDAIKKGQPVAVDYNGAEGIRKVVLSLKKDLIQHQGSDSNLMIMLKALPNSNFKNTMDLLDEMLINNVHRYMMVNLSKEEETLLATKK